MPNEMSAGQKVSRMARQAERIRELELEVARLKAGARPAWHVRDLVLKALLQIEAQCKELASEGHKCPASMVTDLIKVLADNLPGDVKLPAPPPVDKGGVKPYKPLDHGPREP